MKIFLNAIAMLGFLLVADTAFAAEAKYVAASLYSPLGAGIGAGLAVLGAGLGIGKVGAGTLDAIGRNPSAAGKMFLPYILGFALIEGVAIFGIVVALGLK